MVTMIMLMLWLLMGLFVSIAKDKLPALLLWECELHLVTLWCADCCVTLFHRYRGVLHFWLVYTLLVNLDLTGKFGDLESLGVACPDRIRECNVNGDILGVDMGHIVGGLLLDILAVWSICFMVAIIMLWRLTHSHLLDLFLRVECNLCCLSSGFLVLGLVAIRAHLKLSLLLFLTAQSLGVVVAIFSINDGLNMQLDIFTVGIKSWRADLDSLYNILDGAVVLRVLVAIAGLVVAVTCLVMDTWGQRRVVLCTVG